MGSKKLHPYSVSVVVPAWNEAVRIADTIRALQAQTYPADEIIVVDNNSSDDTVKIAKSFKGVRVLSEKRQGIGYTRTKGFNAAKGEILARTDADSVPDFDWLEALVEAFVLFPDLDAVSGPFYYYDLPAKKAARKIEKAVRGNLAKISKKAKFLAGANMGIRRQAWRKVRRQICYRPEFHEDLDLAIHMDKAGMKIGFARDMHVATSVHRLVGSTKELYRYLKRYEDTFHAHGISEPSLKVPMILYLPLQPFGRVVRRLYDEDTQRLTLKKLIDPEKLR